MMVVLGTSCYPAQRTLSPGEERRYLAVTTVANGKPGQPVQIQQSEISRSDAR
jgi:hypothetical protein